MTTPIHALKMQVNKGAFFRRGISRKDLLTWTTHPAASRGNYNNYDGEVKQFFEHGTSLDCIVVSLRSIM